MHMVAWHYATQEAGALTVRAFPLGPSAAYFKSSLFHKEEIESGNEDSFTGHFTNFLRTGFPDTSEHADEAGQGSDHQALPAFAETDLLSSQGSSAGEFAFIPNTHVASFKCATKSCPLVAVCFVDSSNLNLFRDSTFFSGLVGSAEESVHRALMQPTFNPDLPRNPVDINLASYLSAPNAGDVTPASTTGSPETITTASNNRRDRRKKGGGSADFKYWQELTRWKMLVTSLTIPKPVLPTIVSVGRLRASLTWTSPFVPPPSDKTAFGFRVAFCPVGDVAFREEIDLPFNIPGVDACGSQKFIRGVDGSLHEERDEAHLRRTGVDALLFQAQVTGLQPDTQYQFRFSVIYDQRESPLSSYSSVVRTSPVSIPSPPAGVTSESPSKELKIQYTAKTIGYKTGVRVCGELHFTWPEG